MDTTIEQNIAKNILELRKFRNLKQSELGTEIAYSDKMISKWEKGVCVPDVSALLSLANYFGLTVDDLLKENAVEKINATSKQEVKDRKINQGALMALSITAIFMAATVLFVCFKYSQQKSIWQVFIWATPVCALAVIYSNVKYFKINWLNILMFSVVIWSGLTAFYCQFLSYNLWYFYLLGVPLEAMNFVYHLLVKKRVKVKRKNNKGL